MDPENSARRSSMTIFAIALMAPMNRVIIIFLF